MTYHAGTIDDPFTLAEAMANGYGFIGPWDTIYLRGGTYSGDFTCNLEGTAEKPIVFKAYPGERPILSGNFTLSGQYCTWQGIEFTGPYADRSAAANGTALNLGGNGNKLVNCVIHDKVNGILGGDTAPSYEIYGCIVYHNGYDANLGHGMYIQHSGTDAQAIVRNNIVFDNFAFGIHCYGSHAISYFLVDKNTSFSNGEIRSAPCRNILVGGTLGGDNSTISNNRVWHSTQQEGLMVGWGTGNEVTNATVTGNVVVGDMRFRDLITPTVTGNTLYGTAQEITTGDYPDNTWSAYAARPDAVYLEPNTYDTNRAHLTIYNASGADSVAVDISSLGWTGTVTARNVQDYYTDTQELTITGDSIAIDMQAVNRTVATPAGWDAPATTFPAFGCFVLEQ